MIDNKVYKIFDGMNWRSFVYVEKDDSGAKIMYVNDEEEGETVHVEKEYLDEHVRDFIPLTEDDFMRLSEENLLKLHKMVKSCNFAPYIVDNTDIDEELVLQCTNIYYGLRVIVEPVVIGDITKSSYKEIIGYIVMYVDDNLHETTIYERVVTLNDAYKRFMSCNFELYLSRELSLRQRETIGDENF